MKTRVLPLQNRLFGGGGTTSGVFGAIGSVHNVCHSLCMTIVSTLAVFGISTSILPLMFLQTYQLYFWMMALIFTSMSYYFYQKQARKFGRNRNLLLINVGLLIFGLPVNQIRVLSFLGDYMDFFRFSGGSTTVVGIFLLFFGKRFHLVNRPAVLEKQLSFNAQAINTTNTNRIFNGSAQYLPRMSIQSGLFAVIVGGFLANQLVMYRMGIMNNVNSPLVSTTSSAMKNVSNMKLTPFDIALAKERMDRNNDGICDTCGMSIQQCIDSGQMDCNMGDNPAAIGILGSQHVHADFKVYVDNQALDFAKPDYYMKSSFIHVDNSQNKDDASGVIHMHAKKVPLSIFFKSLGMNLTKDSLTLTDGRVLKNKNGKTLKFYLNGHKVDELESYVFQPLDKLLISYGVEMDSNLQKQINSVTNFAKDHQK